MPAQDAMVHEARALTEPPAEPSAEAGGFADGVGPGDGEDPESEVGTDDKDVD